MILSAEKTRPFHKFNIRSKGSLTAVFSSSSEERVFESVGEDVATFRLQEQSVSSWLQFVVAVSGVMGFLYSVWLADFGPHLGDKYLHWMEGLGNNDSTLVITYMLGFFAFCHSGLASLRPKGEEIVGARLWRYIFALVSLPLAFSAIVYFINHRYDGMQLWDFRLVPGMHDFVWWTSFISFFFLYPSTFNLLEVAAVDRPTLHLWETGVIRITRHPQMVGQLLWCLAHTAYLGTTFTCATSAMLCIHHLFAVWNGDRRLRDKFGERFEAIKEKTSIVPFAAILTGKQQLPADYYREFLRLPYLTVAVGSIVAYYAHPFMQAGATLLHW